MILYLEIVPYITDHQGADLEPQLHAPDRLQDGDASSTWGFRFASLHDAVDGLLLDATKKAVPSSFNLEFLVFIAGAVISPELSACSAAVG